MMDPDQSPDESQATKPATAAAVPEQTAAVVEQSAAQNPAPTVEPESQSSNQNVHHAPRDLFGVQAFFTVVIFSIFVITFIVQAFQIPSPSMENTLLIGDFLLVDKLHFAGDGSARHLLPYGSIKRGDIVVFYFPVDPSQFLVKRVIGMPGDHIRLRDRMVYVNGELLQESYAIHKQWIPDGYRDNFPNLPGYSREIDRRWRYSMPLHVNAGELVVPAGEYFVLGDNRDNSLDSRYWGFVPRANIIGRPLVIYLSVRGSERDASNDKLIHSGQTLAHLLHMARWNRMFRLVR
jgi:signal peptidase I